MSTALRLGAFAVLLVVLLAAGYAVGVAAGPIDVGGSEPTHHTGHVTP